MRAKKTNTIEPYRVARTATVDVKLNTRDGVIVSVDVNYTTFRGIAQTVQMTPRGPLELNMAFNIHIDAD